jgi:hypothetical protein
MQSMLLRNMKYRLRRRAAPAAAVAMALECRFGSFVARARMKAWLMVVLAAWLCIGCAQGGSSPSGGGSITMYGTIDEGIAFHK